MAEGRLCWLHLSDLRLPAEPSAGWRELDGLLCDSLCARPERLERIDLVLLSGSIALTGSSDCDAEVDRFLERVLAALGPQSDPDRKPLVVPVPGDSDVAPLTEDEALDYAAFDRYGVTEDPHSKALRKRLC
ncbi:MAG: hypothetical protein JW940_08135 [Polyangiaceae bacterium]|nr:hypothetical protein [Polyangiaceae bacterium]